MKIKKIIIIIAVMFTVVMLVLTLSARSIRNYYFLPNVKCERLVHRRYNTTFELEDGTEVTTVQTGLAINKEAYDRIVSEIGGFFVIEVRQKYGEDRTYSKSVDLNIKTETETEYIIESGIRQSDLLIVESNKRLASGDEVFVINSNVVHR